MYEDRFTHDKLSVGALTEEELDALPKDTRVYCVKFVPKEGYRIDKDNLFMLRHGPHQVFTNYWFAWAVAERCKALRAQGKPRSHLRFKPGQPIKYCSDDDVRLL